MVYWSSTLLRRTQVEWTGSKDVLLMSLGKDEKEDFLFSFFISWIKGKTEFHYTIIGE